MPIKRYLCSISVLAFLAVATSNGIGFSAGDGRQFPTGQAKLLDPGSSPHIAPITLTQKAQICLTKRVKLLPSSSVLTYTVQHGSDSFGNLLLMGSDKVMFDRNSVVLDARPTTLLGVFFKPIAVNQPHLVMFTISAADGTIGVQAGGSPGQTITVTGGTNYVPVIVKPSSNATVSATLSTNGSTNITFSSVTVELVQ